jgi:hypothetical protein
VDACLPASADDRPFAGCTARAAGDDVVPARRPALRARDDVIDRQRVALRAAVLARPPVAREDGSPRDLPAMGVARYTDVGDQADHDRTRDGEVLGAEPPLSVFDDLGPVLEHEHGRTAHGAHVDRLVRSVQHEHATGRPTWAYQLGPKNSRVSRSERQADGYEPSTRSSSTRAPNAASASATCGSSAPPSRSAKNM